MKNKRILAAALALALSPVFATSGQAQELGLRYTKRFDNGHLSVSLGTGRTYAPSYGRRPLRRSTYTGYSGRSYGHGRVWIPGRYEVVPRNVWIPGYSERIWVEPIYDLSCDRYGNEVRVLVRAGYYRTHQRPGHYEYQRTRVWRPGHWSYR